MFLAVSVRTVTTENTSTEIPDENFSYKEETTAGKIYPPRAHTLNYGEDYKILAERFIIVREIHDDGYVSVSVTIKGPRLRKDGQPYANGTKDSQTWYGSNSGTRTEPSFYRMPEWILPAAGDLISLPAKVSHV